MLRTAPEIKKMIEEKLPDAEVHTKDLTGTGDHWQVTIISTAFQDKSMINQHRLVQGIFEADIKSGAVHALSLKTYTPDEWTKSKK